MSSPTAEKWTELNERLKAELKDAEATREGHLAVGRLILFATLVALALIVAVFIVFSGSEFLMLFALIPGIPLLIGIALLLRRQKLADQARSDIERIQRDIRAWKRKNPERKPGRELRRPGSTSSSDES